LDYWNEVGDNSQTLTEIRG